MKNHLINNTKHLFKYREDILLLIIPIILVYAIVYIAYIIAPFYVGMLGYDYDPSYVYLFNSLSIALGVPPQHVDHPGTTMQILGALLIKYYQLLYNLINHTNANLVDIVSTRIESILFFIGTVTTLLQGVTVYLLGRCTLYVTGSILAALVIQSLLFILGDQLIRVFVLNGETVAILLGTILLVLLILEWSRLYHIYPKYEYLIPVSLGIVISCILFSKINFSPFFLLLFVIHGISRQIYALLSFILSSVILLITISEHIYQFLHFIGNIVLHTGKYGSGAEGIINIRHFIDNMFEIINIYPAPLLISLFAISWLLLRLCSCNKKQIYDIKYYRRKFIGICLVALFIQLILVSRHYGQHYYLPSLMLAMILFSFMIFELSNILQQSTKRNKYYPLTFICALYCILAFFIGVKYISINDELKAEKFKQNELILRLNTLMSKYDDYLWVGAYRSHDSIFAQVFALSYVDQRVANIYEQSTNLRAIGFNRWNGMFYTPQGWRDEEYIQKLNRGGKHIIFHLPDNLPHSQLGLELELLDVLPDGSKIYRMMTSI